MEDKIFDDPELDRLIKKVWDSGAVTQEDVRKMCSGEPVLTKTQLEKIRRMKDLQAKTLLKETVA